MDKAKFYKLTWEHYGILLQDLWIDLRHKLIEKDLEIDAIVAILREGTFTAIPLAYKLNMYRVLTIQFKYMLNDGSHELEYISGLQETSYDLPESPLFLLCDTFPLGGKTNPMAIQKIREKFPKARFAFASLVQDKKAEENKDFLFTSFAFDIDENWVTSHRLFKRLGVSKHALDVILPWENEEEEFAELHEKAWDYN